MTEPRYVRDLASCLPGDIVWKDKYAADVYQQVFELSLNRPGFTPSRSRWRA